MKKKNFLSYLQLITIIWAKKKKFQFSNEFMKKIENPYIHTFFQDRVSLLFGAIKKKNSQII